MYKKIYNWFVVLLYLCVYLFYKLFSKRLVELVKTKIPGTEISVFVKPDHFFKVYEVGAAVLITLPKNQLKILMRFVSMCEWNDCRVFMTPPRRRELMSEMKWDSPYMSLLMGELAKRNLVLKVGSGTWYINPNYIYKGQTRTRKSAINLYTAAYNKANPQETTEERIAAFEAEAADALPNPTEKLDDTNI